MDRGVAHEMDNVADRRFVTEADWIPLFFFFFFGTTFLISTGDDLIAELIQNDLDQDATRTVISFEEDRLVCEGNGKSVEAEGWQRLAQDTRRWRQCSCEAGQNRRQESRTENRLHRGR